MKTSELLPPLLDLWTARAEGRDARLMDWGEGQQACFAPDLFRPSTDPAQGQPIMERDHIATCENPDDAATWIAFKGLITTDEPIHGQQVGPTQLIAAMRAKVASVYGDEVPDGQKFGGRQATHAWVNELPPA